MLLIKADKIYHHINDMGYSEFYTEVNSKSYRIEQIGDITKNNIDEFYWRAMEPITFIPDEATSEDNIEDAVDYIIL